MKSRIALFVSMGIAGAIWLANATAQAQTYVANMDGPSESPPNASTGTGFATVTLNLATHTLQVDLSFSGLTGTVTAAHIHAPTTSPLTGTAGVAVGMPGFPSTTSGAYSHTFNTLDSSIYSSAYLTLYGGSAAGAESGLASDLAAGKAYLNIHSSPSFAGGEIRGFLVVPEPTSIALVAIGGIALLFATRRMRRS